MCVFALAGCDAECFFIHPCAVDGVELLQVGGPLCGLVNCGYACEVEG